MYSKFSKKPLSSEVLRSHTFWRFYYSQTFCDFLVQMLPCSFAILSRVGPLSDPLIGWKLFSHLFMIVLHEPSSIDLRLWSFCFGDEWPVLPVVARLLEARSCSDMIMIWYIERLWGLSVMSKLRDSALIFKAWSSTWSDLHPHGKDLLFEVHLSGNSSQSALCTFFLFFPPRLTQAAHILLALEHSAELCCVGTFER